MSDFRTLKPKKIKYKKINNNKPKTTCERVMTASSDWCQTLAGIGISK